jgi:hypothetical protein
MKMILATTAVIGALTLPTFANAATAPEYKACHAGNVAASSGASERVVTAIPPRVTTIKRRSRATPSSGAVSATRTTRASTASA